MAVLHLMVGLPGSGKTTRAIQLAQECRALRLTPDEWHWYLFGDDFYNDSAKDQAHHLRHTKIEELMWDTAQRVLSLGVDVILDFGCWTKAERDAFREKARLLGVGFQIHYMDCPEEVLWERLRRRNEQVEHGARFRISRESLRAWCGIFEPPSQEELKA